MSLVRIGNGAIQMRFLLSDRNKIILLSLREF
jgi:hypothetical protein